MIPGDMTLAEARALVMAEREDGIRCPCCDQYARVYARTLPSAAAKVMIRLYQLGAWDEYVYLPTVLDTMTGTPHQGGYGTLGHFWGLMEQMPGERADGSSRVGWWRLTKLGQAFVRGTETVPKTAMLYNQRCLELTGPPWSIYDALGTRFDYDELMGGDHDD